MEKDQRWVWLQTLYLRTQMKRAYCQAEKDFEMEISREVKHNPKAFYKYAQSKLKTRARIADLKAFIQHQKKRQTS